jgi:rhomboid protease GluP
MFIRTESFSQFLRLYPIISLIAFIHTLLFLLSFIPFFPHMLVFESLAGVNLYIQQGEWWRLITPMFVHLGFAHILFNTFSLILFGPPLERYLGKVKFLLFYLVCGIAANIATYFIQPLTYSHVGASGAIFGLFGYYLALISVRHTLLTKENKQIILPIIIIGFAMTFLQSGINVTAHIFGMIAGFLIGRIGFKK